MKKMQVIFFCFTSLSNIKSWLLQDKTSFSSLNLFPTQGETTDLMIQAVTHTLFSYLYGTNCYYTQYS